MRNLLFLLSAAAVLNANPKNHSVIHGEANVSEEGNLVQIDASDRSILNWDTFSIQNGETTRFVLPSSDSAILNRVTGSQISEIFGLLQANGQVYLINPNGLVIGKEGRIDTAGFVASVYEIQNTDFLNGESLKIQGFELGEIVNLGSITTRFGSIVLIAHRVENSGTLTAPEATVSLNSGHEILLDPNGESLLFIRPDLKGAGIENNGTIEALKLQLQADAAPTSLAIGLGGIIEAGSVQNIGGEIYLVAKEGAIHLRSDGQLIARNEGHIVLHAEKGIVEVTGSIKAPTGTVHLLGEEVQLLETADVDVSGKNKGGTVLVGGDYQGLNKTIPTAKTVVFSKNAKILADATEMGEGGKVILWSDESNDFLGYISAQGGSEGGDGGFVEVSSLGRLAFNGLVSTLSPKGKSGTLLLDPTDVIISAAADNDDTPGGTYNWTGPAVNVNDTVLYSNLALGNVFILTNSVVDQGQAGNLSVNVPLNLTSPNSLFLFSNANMNINSDITVSGNANLHMFATNDLSINSTINWSSSNMFSCNSTGTTTVSGNIICTSGVDLAVVSMSNLFVSGTVSTNGAGILSLAAFGGASQLGLLSGSTLSSQTAITLSPMSFLNLTGAITINTPQALTLTSVNQTPLVRASAATLNTTSSSLNFPKGVNSGGLNLDLTINSTGGDVIFGSNNNLTALNVTASGNIQVQGGTIDVVTGALTLNAGGNLILDDGSNVQVEPPSTNALTLQASENIQLGNSIFVQSSGPIVFLAGKDISATGTSGTIRTAFGDDVNIVADNNNPNPPSFGSGKITLPSGYTLCTNLCAGGPGKVLLYTSVPAINSFPSTINTAQYSPGSFSGNNYNVGTNEFVGYWYLTQPPPDPPLFEIIYKSLGTMTPAVVQQVAIALTEPISNPPQITQVTEGNLQPPSTPDPKTPCRTPPVAIQAL